MSTFLPPVYAPADKYDLLVCYSSATDGSQQSFPDTEWYAAQEFFLTKCCECHNVLASIHLRLNYPDGSADSVQLYEKGDVK